MKVLMINVVCGIKSTGRICTDLADVLAARGHEVKIAYGRGNVPPRYEKYAVRIGSDTDVALHGLRARISDGCGLGSKKATETFIRWIIDFDPDIIHLHNIHGYYINVELLFDYLRACGKPILWTLHDCWAFTGHSAYCDAVGCEKWIGGCYRCPNQMEYPRSIIDRSRKNWAAKREWMTGIPNLTLVTPSEWLASLVKRSFLSDYPVQVVRNGIDTVCFAPQKSDIRERLGISDQFILLGVAGNWNRMKGYDDFIRLSAELDEDYRIVLVGVTSKQKRKLPPGILGIERTNSVKELAEVYSSADLFVNLTYCDNYPTVNLEAMACGTPVLTYDAGGGPETVSARGGIVVPRGDLPGAIQAIRLYRAANPVKRRLEINTAEIDSRTTAAVYSKMFERIWEYSAITT